MKLSDMTVYRVSGKVNMADDIVPNQKTYFDNTSNQYDVNKIIHPALAQKLEILHLLQLLDLKSPKKILDFGCGSGRMTMPFLEKGFDVWAVDFSKKSLQSLISYYQKNRLKSWGTLNTSALIPSTTQFDAIIGSDILHHVDIKQILPQLHKALKPGGIMVLSEPNAWHLLWYLFIFLHLSWEIEKGILQCTMPNLSKNLTLAGFKHVSIKGHGIIPTRLADFSPVLSRLNALKFGNIPLLKYIAFRLIICAKK